MNAFKALDEIDQFINIGDDESAAEAMQAARVLRRVVEITANMFYAADNDQRKVFNLRWHQLRKAVSNG
jgi:hypothetical protein